MATIKNSPAGSQKAPPTIQEVFGALFPNGEFIIEDVVLYNKKENNERNVSREKP